MKSKEKYFELPIMVIISIAILVTVIICSFTKMANACISFFEPKEEVSMDIKYPRGSFSFEERIKAAEAEKAAAAAIDNIIEKDYQEVILLLANVAYGEANITRSKMKEAAVMWCVINRYDAGYGSWKHIICDGAFDGYDAENPIEDEYISLAKDVLHRWMMEKEGYTNVGRVLPADYLYFMGDGWENHYCQDWHHSSLNYAIEHEWNWSLPNPYEN